MRGGGIGRVSMLHTSNESGDPMPSTTFSSVFTEFLCMEEATVSLIVIVASDVSFVRSLITLESGSSSSSARC